MIWWQPLIGTPAATNPGLPIPTPTHVRPTLSGAAAQGTPSDQVEGLDHPLRRLAIGHQGFSHTASERAYVIPRSRLYETRRARYKASARHLEGYGQADGRRL